MGKNGAKVITKNVGDKDISKIFNEMMNSDSANINVAWPKYNKLLQHIDEFIKIFVLLKKSTIMTDEESMYYMHAEEINNFLKKCVGSIPSFKEARFVDVYSRTFSSLNELDDELAAEFRDKYQELKTSNIVNAMQVICEGLMHYQMDIEDINKLDSVFIETMPGVEFQPFPFTSMDYKDMFLDEDIGDSAKKYLLLILHKVYKVTYEVYQLVSSPDIDVDEFVEIILTNLDKLKKHAPGLSRCNKAFRKIQESAELLKSNFNTYFRDLQETKSPTIMMENFIFDVANDTDADPETMRQFKKIISYYRKATAEQRGKDPKMDMLFKKVDEHFKRYDDAVKQEYGDSADIESSDEEIDENDPDTVTPVLRDFNDDEKEQLKKHKDEELSELNSVNKDDNDSQDQIRNIKLKYGELRKEINNIRTKEYLEEIKKEKARRKEKKRIAREEEIKRKKEQDIIDSKKAEDMSKQLIREEEAALKKKNAKKNANNQKNKKK